MTNPARHPPRRQAESNPAQLSLALEAAPAKVRARVRELPAHPRVARSIRGNGTFEGLRRVDPAEAWGWPEVEYSTPNSYPALVFKLDGRDAHQRAIEAEIFDGLPRYSWAVTGTDGAHVAYGLARPVLYGAKARRKPLHTLARVGEFYSLAMKADGAFLGEISHNPVHPKFTAHWGRAKPYGLLELACVLPLGWKPPRSPDTALARRVALWESLMAWAGRRENQYIEVLAAALAANRRFKRPLSPAAVRSVAAWVGEARRRWIADGWHSPRWIQTQRERGRQGGAKPKRGEMRASLHPEAGTNEALKPWEAAGTSRRTWYRRREYDSRQMALIPVAEKSLAAQLPPPTPWGPRTPSSDVGLSAKVGVSAPAPPAAPWTPPRRGHYLCSSVPLVSRGLTRKGNQP